jgi:hypothetical protein
MFKGPHTQESKMKTSASMKKVWEAGEFRRRKITHCRSGHEFDERNTYMDSRGRRHCRTCANQRARRYRFGISQEVYNEMLQRQGGGCAICGEDCPTGRSLAVDHNHTTGKVRGLLCAKCNLLLGQVEDEARLQRMLDYLKSHSGD